MLQNFLNNHNLQVEFWASIIIVACYIFKEFKNYDTNFSVIYSVY